MPLLPSRAFPASQIAITLRAVGGLTTEQIAGAFLVPEAIMGRRISQAKQRIRATGSESLNEGYTATSGPDLLAPS